MWGGRRVASSLRIHPKLELENETNSSLHSLVACLSIDSRVLGGTEGMEHCPVHCTRTLELTNTINLRLDSLRYCATNKSSFTRVVYNLLLH